MLVRAALLISAVILAAGSAQSTQFKGSPKVSGPPACRARCANWGMDLAGMVAMGEYSEGCICKVRTSPGTYLPPRDTGYPPPAAPSGPPPTSIGPDAGDEELIAAGAAVAAAAAVHQRNQEDEAAAAAQRRQQTVTPVPARK